jgi:hypothetical protein
MDTHVVYCSACDRKVRVVFMEPPQDEVAAGGDIDPNGICIDYCTSACTGSMCALFDLPPPEMLERLRDSGLGTEESVCH